MQFTIQDPQGTINSNFGYDNLYQLNSESGTKNHSYLCDSVNNRIRKDDQQYTVNALNQVLQETTFHYSYDKNGNLISEDSEETHSKYTYDAFDRLVAMTEGNYRYEYIYDSFNRRLTKKEFYNGTQTNEVGFLYQDQNEIGSVDSNGKVAELRLLGIGKGAEIGAAVALELGDNIYAPIHDLNGNVVCLVDSSTGNYVKHIVIQHLEKSRSMTTRDKLEQFLE